MLLTSSAVKYIFLFLSCPVSLLSFIPVKRYKLEEAKLSLKKLNIDEYGLNDTDRKYLKAIIERFKGGPVGLNALAASISEEPNTLEDVYEPYLLQEGVSS